MLFDMAEWRQQPRLSRDTGVPIRVLADLRKRGLLPYVKFGRDVWIRPADLETLIAQGYVPARCGPLAVDAVAEPPAPTPAAKRRGSRR